MVDDKKIVYLTNRSRGSVGYVIPDMGNLRRRFEHGETKQVPVEEVRKLDWTPGGHVLLRDYFIIKDADLAKEILHDVEPEYSYTEDKIKEILTTGSMDEFLDFIDFAPEGAIELMKDLAVKLEIPDTRKREALSKATHSNVDNAIKINQQSQIAEKKVEEPSKRRRMPISKNEETKQRRTATVADDKYKVVSK